MLTLDRRQPLAIPRPAWRPALGRRRPSWSAWRHAAVAAALLGPASIASAADVPIVRNTTGLPYVDQATGLPDLSLNGTGCCVCATKCSPCISQLFDDNPPTASLIVSGLQQCPADCPTCMPAGGSFGKEFLGDSPAGAHCLLKDASSCTWSASASILVRRWQLSSGGPASCSAPNTFADYVSAEWDLQVFSGGVDCSGTSGSNGYAWTLVGSIPTAVAAFGARATFFQGTAFCESGDACSSTLTFTNTLTSSSSMCYNGFAPGPCTSGFWYGGTATVILGGC